MEVVSGGASVIAFLGLALQSAKTLYDFLSNVKDGPRDVGQAAHAVQQFQSVLEQLSNCRAFGERGSEAARDHIKICSNDVREIVDRLAALKISEDEKRSGRYWKKIKIALNEKALARMSTVIGNHTSSLLLRLNTLQSNAVFGSVDHLTSIDQTLARQAAIAEDQTQRWQEHQNTLSGMTTDLVQLKDGCSSIREAVGNIPAMSTGQVTQIVEMLRQLQGQVARISAPEQASATPSSYRSTGPHKEEDTHTGGDNSLLTDIEQLCNLVYEKEGTVNTEEVEDVIHTIQKLTSHFQGAGFDESPTESGLEDWGKKELTRDLRAMEGLALASRDIILNEPGLRRPHRDGIFGQAERKRKQFDIGCGVVTLTSTKRRRVRPSHDKSADRIDEDFTALMSFLPEKSSASKMFTFSAYRRPFPGGALFGVIHLSVNNIIPNNSPVFDLVKGGHMREFQAMLKEGKASLRDHDEDGASLLFYATRQPEMCRYLVNQQLDVDHTASVAIAGEYFMTTVLGKDCNDFEDVDLDERNECRRILLEAGSDPTIEVDHGGGLWSSAFDMAVTDGEVECMRIYLDLSYPFAGLETSDKRGYTALLALCCGFSWNRNNLELLLRRGADINARDHEGNSCLHLCNMSSFGTCYPHSSQNGLLFLIESGADIFAKTPSGVSVSHCAYRANNWKGSFSGDFWDSVLALSGHDVAEFRSGSPRIAQYTNMYTRRDFEQLWSGIEHLCPYYEDEYHYVGPEDTDDNSSRRDAECSSTEADDEYSEYDDDDD